MDGVFARGAHGFAQEHAPRARAMPPKELPKLKLKQIYEMQVVTHKEGRRATP